MLDHSGMIDEHSLLLISHVQCMEGVGLYDYMLEVKLSQSKLLGKIAAVFARVVLPTVLHSHSVVLHNGKHFNDYTVNGKCSAVEKFRA